MAIEVVGLPLFYTFFLWEIPPAVGARFAPDLHRICAGFAPDLHRICARFVGIFLGWFKGKNVMDFEK